MRPPLPTGSASTHDRAAPEARRRRRRGHHGRRNTTSTATWATLGGVAAVACTALAWHHPLSGALALLLCIGLAALAARWPLAALALLPAALPAIGLMPWTGWLSVEELDLAVLAMVAGISARLASGRPMVVPHASELPATPSSAAAMKTLLLLVYGAALLVSMARGFSDAGGYAWGWWHGYHEPMNSLRVAKSFFLALLLLPLWAAALRRASEQASAWLTSGLALGLLNVALLAVWERWAYTGLANFSSDYRTTALFWEMHVGGAALDGFLALTMPFAVRELQRPLAPWRWALAAAAAMLGAYACLTTFSRAVYLAVPMGLALMFSLQALERRRAGPVGAAGGLGGGRAALLVGIMYSAGAAAVFSSAGYRGLLALFATLSLLLPMAAHWRSLPRRGWAAGVAIGVALAVLLGGLAFVLPKGVYVSFALAWVPAAALVLLQRWRPQPAGVIWPAALMLALWLALLPAMVLVGLHWGGQKAAVPVAAVAALLLAAAAFAGRAGKPRWPERWRWQGSLLGGLCVVSLMVGVLLGGAYMTDRFATGSTDLQGRQQHWARAFSLLDGPVAWAFGQGTGRYPASHFMSGQTADQTGDHRLVEANGGQHLVLTAGKHTQGWGELYRVSQRIGAFDGAMTVALDVRAEQPAGLHAEVCNKHLLYDNGCQIAAVGVKALPGQWQTLTLVLPGKGLSHGGWLAPRFVVFSLAVNDSGRSLEIDNLRATDADGRLLLANGSFDDGLARWFFSSDRHHMPWHMKNMLLHVLFEQGAVGLLLFSTLVLAAVWRVTGGKARDHTAAPATAAAIVGFLIVGLFDSLLDMPRVAFLFYLVVGLALILPARATTPRRATPPPA
jgi:hypothetical protein